MLARPGYIKLKLNWINVFANSRDNAVPYVSLLEILSLENIYKLKVAIFTHKITNNTSNVPTKNSKNVPTKNSKDLLPQLLRLIVTTLDLYQTIISIGQG